MWFQLMTYLSGDYIARGIWGPTVYWQGHLKLQWITPGCHKTQPSQWYGLGTAELWILPRMKIAIHMYAICFFGIVVSSLALSVSFEAQSCKDCLSYYIGAGHCVCLHQVCLDVTVNSNLEKKKHHRLTTSSAFWTSVTFMKSMAHTKR